LILNYLESNGLNPVRKQKRCWNSIGSPPPLISKNVVFRFRSVSSIVRPLAKTGSDNNNNTAVIATAHPNRCNLCRVIPGLLNNANVVIRFIAPKRELIPDRCNANIAKSTLTPE